MDLSYRRRKGKKEYLYSAFLAKVVHSKRSGMDHTVLPANNTMSLSFVSVHQMSPPQQPRQWTSNCSSLLIYRPWKDERLSWPSWLTCSGWFTHISGYPSATGRAQDSKSTPAIDRCSTAGPRNKMKMAQFMLYIAVVRGAVCECICLHVCVCLPLQGDRKSTRAKFKCQVCRLQFASINVSHCQHTVFSTVLIRAVKLLSC